MLDLIIQVTQGLLQGLEKEGQGKGHLQGQGQRKMPG